MVSDKEAPSTEKSSIAACYTAVRMKIGVPTENFPGERRVALVPASIPLLKKAGLDVVVQQGAGVQAGFTDAVYQEKGAQLVADRIDVFAQADIVVRVRLAGAAGDQGQADLALVRSGQIVIG